MGGINQYASSSLIRKLLATSLESARDANDHHKYAFVNRPGSVSRPGWGQLNHPETVSLSGSRWTNINMATAGSQPQNEVPGQRADNTWLKKLVVAAIDFGTTQSGFALSFLHKYEVKKTDIQTHLWKSESDGDTFKTPTCLLLNPDGTFHSFGSAAETAYAGLAEEDRHRDYRYFRRFKMQLFHEKRESSLYRGEKIKDSQGREFSAITVFALSIKFLRETIMTVVLDRIPEIKVEDVYYVLTAPAIWSEYSKRFMRRAAQEAGINSTHLRIALEPECAAVYVKTMDLKSTDGRTRLRPGVQFMVVDLGGGTLDITVYKINSFHRCEEIHIPEGGPWGGDSINSQFEEYLQSILGPGAFTEFSNNCTEDFLFVRRNFENKKRSFDDTKQDARVTMQLPSGLLYVHREHNHETLEQSVKRHQANAVLVRDKLRIDCDLFRSFFTETIRNIISKIREILNRVSNIDLMICVGGFSDCNVLKKTLREEFEDIPLIVPDEAITAIMKGAIIYGREESIIEQRLCRYTYGLDWNEDFDASKHPPAKREVNEDYVYCKDVFLKLISKGDPVSKSTPPKVITAFPKYEYQTELEFPFYRSDILESPDFIDDSGCHCVGSLTVTLPEMRSTEDNKVTLRVQFGTTELAAEAVDARGNKQKVTFSLIDTGV